MKLLRTMRFDGSDDHVFETAAPADEWAVSGGFAFADLGEDAITGKTKQAFANGFLGVPSFGRSTFACVAEISDDDMDAVANTMAAHLVERFGAPDVAAALPAAREELRFVSDLCDEALINTVFTVRRTFDDSGEIRESFRTIQPPTDKPLHSRIWAVVDDEADA
ncbi:MAG: DUF6505 family protein [Hyphomicrobiaceae bacterium]